MLDDATFEKLVCSLGRSMLLLIYLGNELTGLTFLNEFDWVKNGVIRLLTLLCIKICLLTVGDMSCLKVGALLHLLPLQTHHP